MMLTLFFFFSFLLTVFRVSLCTCDLKSVPLGSVPQFRVLFLTWLAQAGRHRHVALSKRPEASATATSLHGDESQFAFPTRGTWQGPCSGRQSC
ncbi:hypothetical protein LY78DRAFT_224130 [Colletotrichum sublineola]|nr:hypothetical protein LY78DRAFT_224130 [Colletotrichum sublineola]